MSVYTTVSAEDLDAWLARYPLGRLVACDPIRSGIENTNYFVTTERGRYVLTLYERLPADELPFYLNLMAHLSNHGLPCPKPIANLSNQFLGHLNGKPAALATRLSGAPVMQPPQHLVHPPPGRLRVPVVNPREHREDRPGRDHVVEVGDDVIRVV